jgi:hypothetical protein
MRPSPLCSATQIFKDLLSVPFRAKLSLGFLPRGPLCGAAAIGGFGPRELPRCAGTDRSLHARSLFIATSHPRGPEVTAASRVGAYIKRRQLQPHHCAIHRFRGAVGTHRTHHRRPPNKIHASSQRPIASTRVNFSPQFPACLIIVHARTIPMFTHLPFSIAASPSSMFSTLRSSAADALANPQ